MRIYRIILQDKKTSLKQIKLSALVFDIKRHLFKFPIFIGTAKQWNRMMKELKSEVGNEFKKI